MTLKCKYLIGLTTLVVLFAGLQNAGAAVVDVGASKDNTLIQTPDGGLSSGITPYFFAGRTQQGEEVDIRRGVLAFDIAAAIPAGSTINSVTLTLRMSRTQAGPQPVRLARLLKDWGEGNSLAPGNGGPGAGSEPGDATWLHTFWPNQFWTNIGGDYTSVISASTVVSGIGTYTWSSAALAADVQDMLNNPVQNFGWVVLGNENTIGTTKRFNSRQHTIVSQRPRLTIDYSPPAATGACCIGNGVCVIATAAQCSQQGGIYQGDEQPCAPNPCPQPTGACCFPGSGGAPSACEILTAADCASAGGVYQGDQTDCSQPCPVLLQPFVDPLPIPPIAQPISGKPGGEAHYEIAIRQFHQQLHQDLPPTLVWGYSSGWGGAGESFPGPTIEAAAGQPITVKWINDLRDEKGMLLMHHHLHVDECLHGPDHEGDSARITVHLHGGHVPPHSDGHPEQTLMPGEDVVYDYPNNQLPATLWYHDHALGITRLNVYMGLAGAYIIRDQEEQKLSLPPPQSEYELPLIIQDRSFNLDGSLHYPHEWHDHHFGEFNLVNGKVWPHLNVKRGKYRFRIINASNSRTYTLSLSNGAPFHQIGTEGGLLPAPVQLTQLTLMPGERADTVFDFQPYEAGTQIILTNSAPAPFGGEGEMGDPAHSVPNVMKFIVTADQGFTQPLPSTLRPLKHLMEKDASLTRDFELRSFIHGCTGHIWLINGMSFDEVTEYPQIGATEIWRFINRSSVSHPMHVHLVMFQVLDEQAFEVVEGQIIPVGEPQPPPANEEGWKDTVRVNPNKITRVIARFHGYTGRYIYHCHILEHEDHEMMRQFEVVSACPADIAPPDGGDGEVGPDDLRALLAAWGPCPQMPGHNMSCPADLNHDEQVDVDDLLTLLQGWGACD